jgi:hypothetical protein
MSSSQLYPDIIDASTLGPIFSESLYLPIAVEGKMGADGDATVGTAETITSPFEAVTAFGASATSSLTALILFLLKRGVASVIAVASAEAETPALEDRQAVWAQLEDDSTIRIRLTDSNVQADLVGLAESCLSAEGIYNKQIAFGGLASGKTKGELISAATAIASKRFVLVGPGVYDDVGVLQNGSFAAAAVAASVSKNLDISDDLDTYTLAGLTGIEKDAFGLPLFRVKANAGTPDNEFETLLQGGVSPLKQNQYGGVEVTHLRTTYTTDETFDALMTRLIVDQLFLDVKKYCIDSKYLRRGNTAATRADLQAGVAALLADRSNWLLMVLQPDGKMGYGVAITSSPDNRQLTVSYTGQVVRGISTILVDGHLEIPV